MKFDRAALSDCRDARGAVVVIDVLRAFSTAAYAFARGAKEIYVTDTVSRALEIRKMIPRCAAMGEVDGRPIPGFDFSNSPTQIISAELNDAALVHRTTSGTQGIVLAKEAPLLLAASFVVASATARLLVREDPEEVSFVVTGGDEDLACADYIEALITGSEIAAGPFIERALASKNAQLFAGDTDPDFPASDLKLSLETNRFPFAMRVVREGDLLRLYSKRL